MQTQEQFIIDSGGQRVGVILSIEQYERMMEQLEQLAEIRAFDEAKASGEKPIALDRALRELGLR